MGTDVDGEQRDTPQTFGGDRLAVPECPHQPGPDREAETGGDPIRAAGAAPGPDDCLGRVTSSTRRANVIEHHVEIAELVTRGRVSRALDDIPETAVLVDFGSDSTATLVFHEWF